MKQADSQELSDDQQDVPRSLNDISGVADYIRIIRTNLPQYHNDKKQRPYTEYIEPKLPETVSQEKRDKMMSMMSEISMRHLGRLSVPFRYDGKYKKEEFDAWFRHIKKFLRGEDD